MADATVSLPSTGDHMAPHLLYAASFLLNYPKASTRGKYSLDLRIYFDWCTAMGVDPLAAQRYHVQAFARHLQDERGNGPATVCGSCAQVPGRPQVTSVYDFPETMPQIDIAPTP